MPLAAAEIKGFKPAKFNGQDIPEMDVASGKLASIDCHFGVNGEMGNLLKDSDLQDLGPRALDVESRGGIVAEFLWSEFKSKPAQASAELKAFLTTFDDIGGRSALNPAKANAFPQGAKLSKASVAGQVKYKPGSTNKKLASIADEGQLGARWSKVAIEVTLAKKGTIHFHMDGMGNIHEIINKAGDYSHNVTSRELRYIYRNRAREGLMKSVVFYNGFHLTSSGVYKAVIVKCPWN